MSLGIVAILNVQVGKEAEFEAGFKKMQEVVRAHEPGCLLYVLMRKQDDPLAYVVMERYADREALKSHGSSDAYKSASKLLAGCLSGAPEISFLELVSEV